MFYADTEMPLVTDPEGRAWIVEETSRSVGAYSYVPGTKPPEMSLATLRCTSGPDHFTVTVGVNWRDLPHDQLWERITRAHAREEHDWAQD